MSLLLNSVTSPPQWDIDPRSIGDCDIWFDAADTRTITGTSPVTAWASKGNLSLTATNDVGTCVSGAGTINGRNFISCPQGTNLAFTAALTSQPRSVFLVVRGQQQLSTQLFAPLTRGTASTTQMNILLSRATSTSYHYNIQLNAGTTARLNARSTYQTTPGAQYRVINPVPNFFNTTRVYGFVNSSESTGDNFITVNGSEYRAGTTPATLTTNTLASGYDVGDIKYTINTSDTSSTYNTGMDYCEILYYNRAVTTVERKMIEGYLAWKWGVGKNDGPITPLSIPNCLAWYDADVDFNDATSRATSFTFSSGNSVQTWIDKSGNGNTATAATTARGTLTQNVINGKCGVAFGGGATTCLTSTLSLGTSQSFTVFAVGSSASFGAIRSLLSVNGYPGTTGGYMSLQQNVSSPGVWEWTGGTGFAGFTTGVPLGTSRVDVVSAVWSSGSCQYTANGLIQDTSSTTPTALTSSAQLIISGIATGTTLSNSWVGNIFEIIVYDGVLSEDNRTTVEKYLSNKWNLTNYITRLVNYHSSRFWKPFNRPYLPVDITENLAIWFDAADTSTITGTTQVTNWINKGNLGGSATNRTGSCTSGNTFNGLNYISIPGGTDLGFTVAIPSGTTGFYIVARVNTVLTSGQSFAIIERTTSTTQPTLRGIYRTNTTTKFGTGVGTLSTVSGLNLSADITASTLNSTFLATVVNASANRRVITVNGTPQTLVDFTTTTLDTSSVTYTIGRNQYNTSVDIMEIIVCTNNIPINEGRQIEGYLAWKWGLRNLLPSTHPFFALPSNTVKLDPLQIPTASGTSAPNPIFLWLDASDPDGTGVVPTTGTALRQWVDKSGYSRTVSQTTASQCPVFTTDAGYPAVQFTGSSSQFLQSTEPLYPSLTWNSYSIYVVCKPTTLASDSTVFFNTRNALSNTSTNSIYMEVLGSLSGNNGFQLRYNTTTTKTSSVTGTTTAMILAITDTGQANTNVPFFFKNGTALTTTLVGTTSLNASDTGRTVVGARCFSSTFSTFFTGFIYEILVIRDYHVQRQRQLTEGYLAWKWGLQRSLPTTHPFYKISP